MQSNSNSIQHFLVKSVFLDVPEAKKHTPVIIANTIWCLIVENRPRTEPASTQMIAVTAQASADRLKCIAEEKGLEKCIKIWFRIMSCVIFFSEQSAVLKLFWIHFRPDQHFPRKSQYFLYRLIRPQNNSDTKSQ